MGEQRYSFTHSQLWHFMELSGQLMPWLLNPQERTLVPMEWEAGWTPEPVFEHTRGEKNAFPLPGFKPLTTQSIA